MERGVEGGKEERGRASRTRRAKKAQYFLYLMSLQRTRADKTASSERGLLRLSASFIYLFCESRIPSPPPPLKKRQDGSGPFFPLLLASKEKERKTEKTHWKLLLSLIFWGMAKISLTRKNVEAVFLNF